MTVVLEEIYSSLDRSEKDVEELAGMVEGVRLDILDETHKMNPARHTPHWDFDNLDGTWGDHPAGMGHIGGLIKNTKRKKEMGELVHRMWTAFDEIGTAIYADQAQLRAISATGEPRAPLKKVVELEMRRKRIMNEVSMQLTHIESQIASLEEEEAEADEAKKERLAHASTRKPKLGPAISMRPVSANPRANLRAPNYVSYAVKNMDGKTLTQPMDGTRSAGASYYYTSKPKPRQADNPRGQVAKRNHRARLVGQVPPATHVRYRHMKGEGGRLPAPGKATTTTTSENRPPGGAQEEGEEGAEAAAAPPRELRARKVKRDAKGYRDPLDRINQIPAFHRSSQSLTQLHHFEVRPASAHTFQVTRGEESRPRNRHPLRVTARNSESRQAGPPVLAVFKVRPRGTMLPTTTDPSQQLLLARQLPPPDTAVPEQQKRASRSPAAAGAAAAAAAAADEASMPADLRVHTKFRGGKITTPPARKRSDSRDSRAVTASRDSRAVSRDSRALSRDSRTVSRSDSKSNTRSDYPPRDQQPPRPKTTGGTPTRRTAALISFPSRAPDF